MNQTIFVMLNEVFAIDWIISISLSKHYGWLIPMIGSIIAAQIDSKTASTNNSMVWMCCLIQKVVPKYSLSVEVVIQITLATLS
jgi:hypothetical protein